MSETKTKGKTTNPGGRRERIKYLEVAEDIRAQITSGQLQSGDLLPSEPELVARYNVSRNTARNAIATLRAQGLITVIHGRGAFVRRTSDRPAHTHHRTITHTPSETTANDSGSNPASGAGTYADDDTERGDWREVEAPTTYWVKATPALALAVGVAEHTPLFACDRLLEDPTGKRLLHRLYLPFTTVDEIPDLDNNPFITPGHLYTLLAHAGHQLTWTDYITARNPNPDDTTTLHIPDGTPILTTRRTTHTTQPNTPTTHENTNPHILAMEETRRSAHDTQLTYTITPHHATSAD